MSRIDLDPTDRHPEPPDRFRVPSRYTRCRRPRCTAPPVADMARTEWRRRGPGEGGRGPSTAWWAYCAEHLADYNRDVRAGVVWWCGTDADGLTLGIRL